MPAPTLAIALRPGTLADAPALLGVQQREEAHWFGAPETDAEEFDEILRLAGDLARNSRVSSAADRPVAAAWVWGGDEAILFADPEASDGERDGAYDGLLGWLETRGAARVEALAQDRVRRVVLERRGWRAASSSFELLRPPDAPPLPAPRWPDGVRLTGLDLGSHLEAAHDLIYRRSGWLEVEGHRPRTLEVWRQFFDYAGFDPAGQVLAWAGGTPEESVLVGIATGRTYSDGTGYVSQLAVDRAWQRRGLGRALLTEALSRRRAAGAQRVGLSVWARNVQALGLYRSVGLEIDRESVAYTAPR